MLPAGRVGCSRVMARREAPDRKRMATCSPDGAAPYLLTRCASRCVIACSLPSPLCASRPRHRQSSLGAGLIGDPVERFVMHVLFVLVQSVSGLCHESTYRRCPKRFPPTPGNKLGSTGVKINSDHKANVILESRRDPPCPASLATRTVQLRIRGPGRDSPAPDDS